MFGGLRSTWRARQWVLVMAFMSVGGGFVLIVANPAGATSATYSDPRPCSAAINSGVCISEVSVDYTATTVTVGMTVGQATDPSSDPNWLDTADATFVGWVLCVDPSGDSCPYDVKAGDFSGDSFVGVVDSASPAEVVCGTTDGVLASFDVATNSYQVSFPASCINSPSSLSAGGHWDYDDDGTVVTYEAPTQGPCCSVVPDSSTTTTTSSTTTSSTIPVSSSTTTSIVPVTSTTGSPVSATKTAPAPLVTPSSGSSSSSSGQLAFTGPGRDTWLTAIVGGALLLLGFSLFALADVPRQLRFQLAGWGRRHDPRHWARRLHVHKAENVPTNAGSLGRDVGRQAARASRWIVGR